jgi:hypothetical protein
VRYQISIKYILQAPALYDAHKKCLFWIVHDVGTNPIDHPSEIAVWEMSDLRHHHIRLEWFKYFGEQQM